MFTSDQLHSPDSNFPKWPLHLPVILGDTIFFGFHFFFSFLQRVVSKFKCFRKILTQVNFFTWSYVPTAELGDFDPHQHTVGYVSEFCFVPNQTEELERRIAAIHRRLG